MADDAMSKLSIASHKRMVGASSSPLPRRGEGSNTNLAPPGHEHDAVGLVGPHLLRAIEFDHLANVVVGDEVIAVGQARDGIGPGDLNWVAELAAVLVVLDDA